MKKKYIKIISIITILVLIATGIWIFMNIKNNTNNQKQNVYSDLTNKPFWTSAFGIRIENSKKDIPETNEVPYEMHTYIFPDMSYEQKMSTEYPVDQVEDFMTTNISHNDSWTPSFTDREITNEVIPYDGKKRSISCWGDSMTEGNGTGQASITVDGDIKDISDSTFPSVLEQLTGIKTYNLGVGGETSIQIAQRQGGIPMVLDGNVNITEQGGVNCRIISPINDMPVDISDFSGYGGTVEGKLNRVYIDKKKYKVTYNGDSHRIFLKLGKKSSEGSAVVDSYASGTRVNTAASIERRRDILIIEMGSNGGWDDYQELIDQYDAMIKYSLCDYYIIIGDTDDPDYTAGLGDTPWEAALRKAYGDHFINMRTYLIENGLDNCGMSPTYADMECYYNGQISKKLRSDYTHLNAYGYYAKGIGIYNKGVELGYWK